MFFHNLRVSRRAAFGRYRNPGFADDVLWYPMCRQHGKCDYYSAGSSQCIYHTQWEADELHGDDEESIDKPVIVPENENQNVIQQQNQMDSSSQVSTDQKVASQPGPTRSLTSISESSSTTSPRSKHVLLNSNCQLRTSPTSGPFYYQIFHCPRNLPVAVFVLPKSGTTSTLNWIMGHEDVWPTLDDAARAMRKSPVAMMEWLASESSWWMVPEHIAKIVANRVMHRYPATRESLREAKHVTNHLKFLPPAHLCPTCCTKGMDRLKVIVARNPYVRLASFYKYRYLQNRDEDGPKESAAIKEALIKGKKSQPDADQSQTQPGSETDSIETNSESDSESYTLSNSESKFQDTIYESILSDLQRDQKGKKYHKNISDDERSLYLHLDNDELPKHLRRGVPAPSTGELYYDSWAQFPVWVKRFLELRTKNPFHSQADLFPSRETEKKCDQIEEGNYQCVHFEFEFDASDIFHARPFVDMVTDTRLGENLNWRDFADPIKPEYAPVEGVEREHDTPPSSDKIRRRSDIQILHLENIHNDLKSLYDRLCSEYGSSCDQKWIHPWSGQEMEFPGNPKSLSQAGKTSPQPQSESHEQEVLQNPFRPKRVIIPISVSERAANQPDQIDIYGIDNTADISTSGSVGIDPDSMNIDLFDDITSDYVGDNRFDYEKEVLSRYDRRNVFPQVYPTFNKRPKGSNACDFNPKTLKFTEDCHTTWEELWTRDGGQMVEMVKEHFGFDFKIFGYSEDWRDVMPLKMETK